MCRLTTWGLLLLLAACEARLTGAIADPNSVAGDAGSSDDAAGLGPWSTPMRVGPAATAAPEDDVTLSSNALELIFAIDARDATGKDLYYTSRASTTAAWAPAVRLAFNSATTSDETPRFSADDKTLYFASGRGDTGGLDIYQVAHPAPGSTAWGTPAPVTEVNTAKTDKWFMRCGTDHYVMVQSVPDVPPDLVEGTFGGPPATPIAELNSPQNDTGAFITQDCLTIYFASTRSPPTRIYRSHRASLTEAWQPPAAVTEFPIPGGNEEDPWLSPDGRTFVFASDRNGDGDVDIYISTR